MGCLSTSLPANDLRLVHFGHLLCYVLLSCKHHLARSLAHGAAAKSTHDRGRHKRRRQKYRSWDVDDVREMEHNRRYQAWMERQARETEQADQRDAEGASSQQAQQVC